jgi:hypothetical protein
MTEHGAAESGGHIGVAGYVQVAVFLTVITLIELFIIIEPVKEYMRAHMTWALPLVVPTLLVLSAVKFVGVVGFYMHLRYDAGYYRAVFGAPMVGALLMVVVIMLLYGTSLFHA